MALQEGKGDGEAPSGAWTRESSERSPSLVPDGDGGSGCSHRLLQVSPWQEVNTTPQVSEHGVWEAGKRGRGEMKAGLDLSTETQAWEIPQELGCPHPVPTTQHRPMETQSEPQM